MSAPGLSQKLADIIARARDSSTAARAIFGQGLYADAVSRAYYAAYHAVVALHTAYGKAVSSHAVVKASFHKDFVKTRVFGKESGRSFERLFDDRQLGDYSYDVEWTVDRVLHNLDAADALIGEIEQHLKDHGYLS
jgi:hypothetical protein